MMLMNERLENESDVDEAFAEWKELFTKGRNGKLTDDERRRLRILSERLGRYFFPRSGLSP